MRGSFFVLGVDTAWYNVCKKGGNVMKCNGEFTVGETAYIVKESNANRFGMVCPMTVKSIGRKYVTVESAYGTTQRYRINDILYGALVEEIEYGSPGLLFSRKDDADGYVRKRQVISALLCTPSSVFDKIPLKDLLEMWAIIDKYS